MLIRVCTPCLCIGGQIVRAATLGCERDSHRSTLFTHPSPTTSTFPSIFSATRTAPAPASVSSPSLLSCLSLSSLAYFLFLVTPMQGQ